MFILKEAPIFACSVLRNTLRTGLQLPDRMIHPYKYEDPMMKKVEQGNHVTIEYESMIKEGEVVESSADTGPFELEIGKGLMPAGFENAILGMQVGEEKTIVLQPEEAYGSIDGNLLHTVNKSVFGDNINPEPGMVLG